VHHAAPGHERGPAEAAEVAGSLVTVDAGTIRVYGASSVAP
jgi:hypothetical protein